MDIVFCNCFYTAKEKIEMWDIFCALKEKYNFECCDIHLRDNKTLLLKNCGLKLHSVIRKDFNDTIMVNEVNIKIVGEFVYPMYMSDRYFKENYYEYD